MMFVPKTERLKKLGGAFPHIVQELEAILDRSTAVYLDYANIRSWSNKLDWHVSPKRLRQFLTSFDCQQQLTFYYGTLQGDVESENLIKEAKSLGYNIRTKPVKKIRISIDASSISAGSPDILRNFISRPLLESLSIKQIEELNAHLKILNTQGTLYFEDLKCNFDVEIGMDMLAAMGHVESFLLWSCDGDFADAISQLLAAKKNVGVFGTSGRIARELNDLRPAGLRIYEVMRLREFICWTRELEAKYK
jgi:uncharacterized LabA/DUF88 family protein